MHASYGKVNISEHTIELENKEQIEYKIRSVKTFKKKKLESYCVMSDNEIA